MSEATRRDPCAPLESGEEFQRFYITREDLENKLESAVKQVDRAGIVTLTGFGGVGKTTLVNKVLRSLEDRGEIRLVPVQVSPEWEPLSLPEIILDEVSRLVKDKIWEKLATWVSFSVNLVFWLELLTGVPIPISVSPRAKVSNPKKEMEKLAQRIAEQPSTKIGKIIVFKFDDVSDITRGDVRELLYKVLRSVCDYVKPKWMGGPKLLFLLLARETATDASGGVKPILSRDELGFLNANSRMIEMGGFDKQQVLRFVAKLGFALDVQSKNDIVKELVERTQGRPRVICQQLQLLRKKHNSQLITLERSQEIPESFKAQLEAYLGSFYTEYFEHLHAVSALPTFTEKELNHVLVADGAVNRTKVFLNDAEVVECIGDQDGDKRYRINSSNSYLVDRVREIYESLLTREQKFSLHRRMADYFLKTKPTDITDVACIFHADQAVNLLDEAHAAEERDDLLRAIVLTGSRFMSYAAESQTASSIAMGCGMIAYEAATRLGKHLEAISIVSSLLELGLYARAPTSFMQQVYQSVDRHFQFALDINNDAARYQYALVCYYYASYLTDIIGAHDQASLVLEKAVREVGKEIGEARINDQNKRVAVLIALLNCQASVATNMGNTSQTRTILGELTRVLEEEHSLIGEAQYLEVLSTIEFGKAQLDIRDGKFKEATTRIDALLKQTGDEHPSIIFRLLFNVGQSRLLAGDFRTAVEPLEQALGAAPTDQIANIILIELALVLALVGCETYDQLSRHIARLQELVKQSPFPHLLAEVNLALASKMLMDGSAATNPQQTLELIQDSKDLLGELQLGNVVDAEIGYQVALAVLGARSPKDLADTVERIVSSPDRPLRKFEKIIATDIVKSLLAGEPREALKHYLRYQAL